MSDMAEKDLAAELQGTKGDNTEWGEPEPTPAGGKSEKRRLAAMVSVRFAPEELEALQVYAQHVNKTVSGLLRGLALAEIGRTVDVAGLGFVVLNSASGVREVSVSSSYAHSDGWSSAVAV